MRRPKCECLPVIEGKAFAGGDPATYELEGRDLARCASPPGRLHLLGERQGVTFFCRSLEQRF